MKKQFTTYEIAIKLKELGFDELSNFGGMTSLYNKKGKHTFYSNYGFMDSGLYDGYISAPLWQQAIDWFKIKYNVHIIIKPYNDEEAEQILYEFEILEADCNDISDYTFYHTYEEAREQAILKAVELINQQNEKA